MPGSTAGETPAATSMNEDRPEACPALQLANKGPFGILSTHEPPLRPRRRSRTRPRSADLVSRTRTTTRTIEFMAPIHVRILEVFAFHEPAHAMRHLTMFPAFLATVLFSLSVIFAGRTTRMLGGTMANFYRLCVSPVLLAVWAHALGKGLGAVGTRKAYALVNVNGQSIDGGTAAYQRILGGLFFAVVPALWIMRKGRLKNRDRESNTAAEPANRSGRQRVWLWVLL